MQNTDMAAQLIRKENKNRENHFLGEKLQLPFPDARRNDEIVVGKKPPVSIEGDHMRSPPLDVPSCPCRACSPAPQRPLKPVQALLVHAAVLGYARPPAPAMLWLAANERRALEG